MTLRLLGLADDYWRDLNGYAVGHGVQLKKLEVADFLDYVWWWLTREQEPENRTEFELQLWRPPRGEKATSGPWSPEAESAAFQSVKAQLG